MNKILQLTDHLLISEGATRKCYRHPCDANKCVKIEKEADGTNQHDVEAHHLVKPVLNRYIAAYDNELVATNLGKALVCELIRDDNGPPSHSLAHYRRAGGNPQRLTPQFTEFFNLLRENDLFFYDFNPMNFIIQQTAKGEQLKYTDLKSLGKIKTAFSLEKIPYFARMKLNRRIRRFTNRFLFPAETSSP